jgi:hypothetical protein
MCTKMTIFWNFFSNFLKKGILYTILRFWKENPQMTKIRHQKKKADSYPRNLCKARLYNAGIP